MARYQITEQPHYRQGKLYLPDEEVELDADEVPADHWNPLDDDAKAGIAAARERISKLQGKKPQGTEAKASAPAAASPPKK